MKLRFRLGLVTAKPLAHNALEYGLDLHVNERQKIRHYRSRSTEVEEEKEEEEYEEERMPNRVWHALKKEPFPCFQLFSTHRNRMPIIL